MKLVTIVLVFLVAKNFSQTTLILQPDAESGKDALLHGLSSQANTNYGDNSQFVASAWTFGSKFGIVRSVIDFDISTIPENVIINSAYLSLYAWNSDNGMGPHSGLSGSNACWLQRITSEWDEETITWNTQPSTTTVNQVFLYGTSNPSQDYIDIEVTNLIKDMISDPQNSYGFLLKLQNEEYYRRMNFCTSDHEDLLKHPKLVITYSEIVPSDTCINLQPDAESGKDALLHGLSSQANTNYGDNSQFVASAWTFGSKFGIIRSVIDFDISTIPENVIINSAYLSLYAWNSDNGMGPHSGLSGSNACWLQRITSEWDEETITWNTQPSTTTVNQVFLYGTSNPSQDYIDIEVTNLIKDMISDPQNSYGFLLKLQNEEYYRRMNFCTSDHEDLLKHPKLEICYSVNNQIRDYNKKKMLTCYPNPNNGKFNIDLKNINLDKGTIQILDYSEKVLKTRMICNDELFVDISDLQNGFYIIKVNIDNMIYIEKIMKTKVRF